MTFNEAITLPVVMQYLSDADYPISLHELIELADTNGAPDQVLELLGSMPQQEFQDSYDLERTLSESAGLSAY